MKTLFAFDDHSIPFRSNLDLVLLPGVKYSGNPVLRRGRPGDPDAKWARLWAGTVLHDQGKFRMWYSGVGSIEEWTNMQFQALYAESDDGFDWHKPKLGLVEYRGSSANNLVDVGGPVEMPAVMRDDDDDVPNDQRYKMYSENLHANPIEPFVAVSAEGLRWRIIARPSYRGVSLYRFKGHYHSAFVDHAMKLPGGFEGGRIMSVIRSSNFCLWESPPVLAFHRASYFTNPPDISEQVHTPAGFWNRGNVVVGVYGQIHQVECRPGINPVRLDSGLEEVRVDLGLFVSNDGLHFREPIPGFKIVARGQEGQWDGGCVVPAHAFVNVGEHTYLYYGGWDNGFCYENSAGDVGVVFWRRDGMGHVRVRDHDRPGICQTETIETGGIDRSVYVNFDVDAYRPGCGLDFELVDVEGVVIPGYSAADCVTCSEPGLRQSVRWKDHHVISARLKDPVALRVIFRSNHDVNESLQYGSSPMLYCVYITESEEPIDDMD